MKILIGTQPLGNVQTYIGDARNLELESESVDGIITSPPYSIALDYVKNDAHALEALGHDLEKVRQEFIGVRGTGKNKVELYNKDIKGSYEEMHRVLKATGSFYLHCDANAVFDLKPLCDKIYGRENFRREIIWNVGSVSGFKSQVKGWVRQHDTILYYTSSDDFTFNKLYIPYNQEYIKKMFRYKDEDGRLYRKRRGGKQYLDERPGNLIGDVWNDIYSFQTATRAKEYLGYPTQKPERLLKRIILASTNPEDIVADFFCGSGTTLAVAEKLGRKWIGSDITPQAIHITRKRLLDISKSNDLFNWNKKYGKKISSFNLLRLDNQMKRNSIPRNFLSKEFHLLLFYN